MRVPFRSRSHFLSQLGSCSDVTMEGVAALARTGKASLYKRWPNRAELVVAALRRHGGPPLATPADCGSLREDALALLRRGATSLNGLFGEAVRGLIVVRLYSRSSQ